MYSSLISSAPRARNMLSRSRWENIYQETPVPKTYAETGLRLAQLRVLGALSDALGPLSRSDIAEIVGYSVTEIGGAIGCADPIKRAAQERDPHYAGSPEKPRPTLLTLGYVREDSLRGSDVSETVVRLTSEGRAFLAPLGPLDLPPVRRGKSEE